MSVSLMSSVFNCNMPELKTDDGKTVPDTTAKAVLLALADNANDEGEGSYPGVDTLCRKTNYSTSTVCNALNALRTHGFIILVGRSKRDTNNYTVSAAEISKFQWPKREDFSHRNASVSAAETNPYKPSSNHDRYSDPIAAKLSELHFPLNPNAGTIIQGWKDDFPNQDHVILRAIEEAHLRGARSLVYVDRILIGWKANGVPPTREEERKAAAKQAKPAGRQSIDEARVELAEWLQTKGVQVNGVPG